MDLLVHTPHNEWRTPTIIHWSLLSSLSSVNSRDNVEWRRIIKCRAPFHAKWESRACDIYGQSATIYYVTKEYMEQELSSSSKSSLPRHFESQDDSLNSFRGTFGNPNFTIKSSRNRKQNLPAKAKMSDSPCPCIGVGSSNGCGSHSSQVLILHVAWSGQTLPLSRVLQSRRRTTANDPPSIVCLDAKRLCFVTVWPYFGVSFKSMVIHLVITRFTNAVCGKRLNSNSAYQSLALFRTKIIRVVNSFFCHCIGLVSTLRGRPSRCRPPEPRFILKVGHDSGAAVNRRLWLNLLRIN